MQVDKALQRVPADEGQQAAFDPGLDILIAQPGSADDLPHGVGLLLNDIRLNALQLVQLVEEVRPSLNASKTIVLNGLPLQIRPD